MSQEALPNTDDESLAKRRVPCMVAFIHPFRIVNASESPPWDVTVEDVNRHAWDYVALHELVGGANVGLPEPYHMLVSRDGGVALPPLPQLRNDQEAVEFYNRCFAAMLLGGVYCEAISLDGLDFGSIIDWKYVRVHTSAPAAANRFHQLIRLQRASAYEAIALSAPRTVLVTDLCAAVTVGRAILDAVPELSGEFLLKGVTGIARRDWGAALANLWIIIEQISSRLWEIRMVKPAQAPDPIPGRADQLSDPRTWTIAVRHELLHQIGVLSRETLVKLSTARKARNALAHNGKHPTAAAAQAAYGAVTELLQVAVPELPIPLLSLDIANHGLSDPFAPREPVKLNPTHWMEIPKLPGEAELERLEAKHRVARRERDEPT
jgi:hypothetical protein